MKTKRAPMMAVFMAAILFVTSVLTSAQPVRAQADNADIALQAASPLSPVKALTSIGKGIYDSLATRHWQNECKTWMAATGEQLDVLETKIDGLDENVKAVQETLGDIQAQIDSVSSQITAMNEEISKNVAGSTLTTRFQTVNELAAITKSLCDDLNKIGDDGINNTERAQRVNNFVKKVEDNNLESQFDTAINLLTARDQSGTSITEAYLNYMKAGKPFYFQIYNDQLTAYGNFSDILLSTSYVLVEYYHYYSGPYNPRSRFITVNQADLIEKTDTALDAIYTQLDINENDAPYVVEWPGKTSYYGTALKHIEDGIFTNADVVRLRSTVDRKSYLIALGNKMGLPDWNQAFNLKQTPYGPTEAYAAGKTVSDGLTTYHPAKSKNEIYNLMKSYDYGMKVVTSEKTIYQYIFDDNNLVYFKAMEIRKDGKVEGPLIQNFFVPIALWDFEADGQYYVETTQNTDPKLLTYEDAKKGIKITTGDHSSSILYDHVFNYIFVQDDQH